MIASSTLIGAAIMLWRYTPLADYAAPDRLAQWLETFKHAVWAPVAVVGVYVLGGAVMFPLTVLIAATAIVFDPLPALALSFISSMASAAALYVVGAKLTRRTIQSAFSDATERLSAALEDRSVIAIAVIRTVPIAPFTVVNLAAGAIGLRFRDYLLGTALGLAPGIIVLTAFGHLLKAVWEEPSAGRIAILVGVVLAWIALSLILQRLVSRRRSRQRSP